MKNNSISHRFNLILNKCKEIESPYVRVKAVRMVRDCRSELGQYLSGVSDRGLTVVGCTGSQSYFLGVVHAYKYSNSDLDADLCRSILEDLQDLEQEILRSK